MRSSRKENVQLALSERKKKQNALPIHSLYISRWLECTLLVWLLVDGFNIDMAHVHGMRAVPGQIMLLGCEVLGVAYSRP